MRFVTLLCLTILAPTALIADSAETFSQAVEFEFDIRVSGDLGSSRDRWTMIKPMDSPESPGRPYSPSILPIYAGPFVLVCELSWRGDTEYSAECEVRMADGSATLDRTTGRFVDFDPIGFDARLGETVELTHELPDATLDLTVTASEAVIRFDDRSSSSKSKGYLAIAALALLLIGVFMIIGGGARKRSERY